VPQRDDVAAFDRRAGSYERGRLGHWHRLVAERTAEIALQAVPAPGAVLDVGCGTGVLLRLLAERVPGHAPLHGVDPSPAMISAGRAVRDLDSRVRLVEAAAEDLPFPDDRFDLVVSSVSFDHWADQSRGLHEAARVLAPEGRLVLADLFAGWLAVTTWVGRPRARTPVAAERLLTRARLRPVIWRRVYSLGPLPLVQAVVVAASDSASPQPAGAPRRPRRGR
jgi:ubiquinone/menaquinone biosynthesis C-methylase UbiE